MELRRANIWPAQLLCLFVVLATLGCGGSGGAAGERWQFFVPNEEYPVTAGSTIAVQATASVTGAGSFQQAPTLTVLDPGPFEITVVQSTQTNNRQYQLTFQVAAPAGLAPGTYPVTVRATAQLQGPAATATRDLEVIIRVVDSGTPIMQWDLGASSTTLEMNSPSATVVQIQPVHDPAVALGAVEVSVVAPPAGFVVTPESASATAASPASFTIEAGIGVAPGQYPIVFRAMGPNQSERQVTVQVTILPTPPPAPAFTVQVLPQTVALNTDLGGEVLVRISGGSETLVGNVSISFSAGTSFAAFPESIQNVQIVAGETSEHVFRFRGRMDSEPVPATGTITVTTPVETRTATFTILWP
jgi:hypothetical protein